MTNNSTDAELIADYLNGCTDSVNILINRYYHQVLLFVCRMTGNQDIAVDLCQDIFIKFVNDLDTYTERQQFKSWLFKIARNTVIDWFRHKKSQKGLLMAAQDIHTLQKPVLLSELESPDNQVVNNELQAIILTAVNHLPQQQREVFLLREHSGMSFKEISSVVGCSTNTALGRMHYALKNIRIYLVDYLGAEVNDVM